MSVKSGKGKSGSTSAKVFVEENKDMGEMENLGIETVYDVTLQLLSSINVSQSAMENRLHLDDYGGPQCLASNLHVDLKTGLRREQVLAYRQKFGANRFPDSPIDTYWKLLAEALSDTTLVILSIASIVSLVIGIYQDPEIGWVEGAAILIAVFAVSSISAGNDYNKQLQFRDLENASAKDELCSIMRDETMDRYPVEDIVVGDILCLQTGDAVPADCIIIDNSEITTNEASLTGEGEDLKKSTRDDCFLLSSCLVVEGDDCHALVIAVGKHSQWGKIKENLRVTVSNTPLQDKLEEMTKKVRCELFSHCYFRPIAGLGSVLWPENTTDLFSPPQTNRLASSECSSQCSPSLPWSLTSGREGMVRTSLGVSSRHSSWLLQSSWSPFLKDCLLLSQLH